MRRLCTEDLFFSRHESSQLNDSEFDEILQRNKTVSSTAISRAVQDASAGWLCSFVLFVIVLDILYLDGLSHRTMMN